MVQNVVFVADDAVEQPFVGGSAQFFKRPEIRRGEVAARIPTDGRSTRCRSDALVNPHQALDKYCSLAITTVQQCGIIHAVCTQDLQCVHSLCTRADDGPNVFRHAQVVSDGDAEDLYCSGSLDAWYWRRRLYARLSALVEENDIGVFRRIYLQIVGPRPCLAVGQLCLSTAGVYGCNDNVRIVSEPAE